VINSINATDAILNEKNLKTGVEHGNLSLLKRTIRIWKIWRMIGLMK